MPRRCGYGGVCPRGNVCPGSCCPSSRHYRRRMIWYWACKQALWVRERTPSGRHANCPVHTASLFHSALKRSFSANPSHRSLSSSSSGLTTWFPRLFAVTSERILFYFLVFFCFYGFWLLVPCSRLSWLMSAFERRLKYHLVSYRIVHRPPDTNQISQMWL